jgi:hypothetical protein
MDKDPLSQPNPSEDLPSAEVSDETKKELLGAIKAKLSIEGYTRGAATLDGTSIAREVYLKLEPSTVIHISNYGDNPNRESINVPNLRVESIYYHNPANLGNPPSEKSSYSFFKQADGKYVIERVFKTSQKRGDWAPVLPEAPVSNEVLHHIFKKALEPDELERSMGLLKLTEQQAQELLRQLRKAEPTNDPYDEATTSQDPDEPEEIEEIEEID